jgi:hypothetical protein
MLSNLNHKRQVYVIIFGLLIFCSQACTKNFDRINTPSNQIVVTKVDAGLLGQEFAFAQYWGIRLIYQAGENLYGDHYAQYFAQTQASFTSDQYLQQGTSVMRLWDYFYSNPATQLLFVERYSSDHNMPLANAIAKVWRVEIYHRMSDYFGPIIYSQFGNEQFSVGYDSQADIYHSFFKTLDSAVAVLKSNAGKNAFGGNDQMYAGSADKWYLFANSLRLRLAMRIAYVEPALARAEAEKAVAAGVIEKNTDNANIISTPNSINNLSSLTYISEFRMSAAMQSVLVGYNDPRISEYFDTAKTGGGYKGVRNGLPAVEKVGSLNANNSFVSKKYLPIASGGANLANRVLSASEVAFLKAEGALRGWNMGGTDLDFYNAGISLSLSERTNSSASAIQAYLNSTAQPIALNDKWKTPAMSDIPVQYQVSAGFEKKLEQILTQKWIALYPDGWEAWAERRRTGYPKGYPLINSLNPYVPKDLQIRRITFSSSEISNNNAAVMGAVKLLNGPDRNDTKLWWDAK